MKAIRTGKGSVDLADPWEPDNDNTSSEPAAWATGSRGLWPTREVHGRAGERANG